VPFTIEIRRARRLSPPKTVSTVPGMNVCHQRFPASGSHVDDGPADRAPGEGDPRADDAYLSHHQRPARGWDVEDGAVSSPGLAAICGLDRVRTKAPVWEVGNRESVAAVGEHAHSREPPV
jgi:hypothetical protein